MRFAAFLRASWRDPVQALSGFADEPWAAGFVTGEGQGRWSYVTRHPAQTLWISPDDPADPFEALARLIGEPAATDPAGPPFQGGALGLACYELGDRVEPLGLGRAIPWPDLAAARYDAILAFDHQSRTVVAVGRGLDQAGAETAARRALSWLEAAPAPRSVVNQLSAGAEASSGDAYEAATADITSRIAAGEIFQANIARSWQAELAAGAAPFDLFRRLTDDSPAPHAAYLRLPGLAVVSNSPERFVSVADGLAETKPIKGTRPRGADPASDRALAEELAASEKDRAENLMIVDLMRNDLARVCRPGSVKAPDLFVIESYANVHHLVSTVQGRLAAGLSAVDLLRAAFPPGSVTGAPKVQAMKVIAGHEPPRGPYCGSLFWAGVDGAFDSSVLIRTAAMVETPAGWRVEARAGAGIVADSEPVAERLETEAKIAAVLAALTAA
jgi:para-aminobenzoate synthetase component I